MKQKSIVCLFVLALLTALWLPLVPRVAAQTPTVRAILFYSPSCSHCHYVIEQVLMPMADEYGDKLLVLGINISDPGGRTIYENAISHLSIPENRLGVPMLIVEDTVLVGSREIPEQFPGMVEAYLSTGGIEWPDIPGLPAVLAANGLTEDSAAAAADAPEAAVDNPQPAPPPEAVAEAPPVVPATVDLEAVAASDTVWDRVMRDPVGNGLSIVILLGMIVALVYALVRVVRTLSGGLDALALNDWPAWKSWAVAALCVVGLGVSAYMAYVETTETAAVCGPVGDCNTVQQSEYASLFGVPIGILGLIGYGAMLLSWAGVQWGSGGLRRTASLLLLGMVLVGTAFSIYLTFLEPFVIGATCAWCLTSAVVMTLILLLLVPVTPAVAPQTVRRARAGA